MIFKSRLFHMLAQTNINALIVMKFNASLSHPSSHGHAYVVISINDRQAGKPYKDKHQDNQHQRKEISDQRN